MAKAELYIPKRLIEIHGSDAMLIGEGDSSHDFFASYGIKQGTYTSNQYCEYFNHDPWQINKVFHKLLAGGKLKLRKKPTI